MEAARGPATGEAGAAGSVCGGAGAPGKPGLDRRELEERIAQLEEAVRSQRQIGVLVGIVAERTGCSLDEAWGILVRLSQDTNVKVREIARVVVEAAAGRADAADGVLLSRVTEALPGGLRWGRVSPHVVP